MWYRVNRGGDVVTIPRFQVREMPTIFIFMKPYINDVTVGDKLLFHRNNKMAIKNECVIPILSFMKDTSKLRHEETGVIEILKS